MSKDKVKLSHIQMHSYMTNPYFKACIDAIEHEPDESKEAIVTELLHRLCLQVHTLDELRLHDVLSQYNTATQINAATHDECMRKEQLVTYLCNTAHEIPMEAKGYVKYDRVLF